jgi:hypothetical protein
MANLKGLASILSELRVERTNLANQLRHVDAALSVLGKLDGGINHSNANQPKRTISAALRRKMAQAQKARWAEANGQAPKPKHTMSAASRKKIAAARRARWAKVKAQQKKK